MTRCVVCGARPTEECNPKTHQAHYRMWLKLRLNPDGNLRRDGTHIIITINRARQTTQTDEFSPSMQNPPTSRVWKYR